LKDSAHHASRLRLKTVPLILLSIALGPLGNVLLGRGMKGVGPVHVTSLQDFLSIAQRTFSSGYLWMGIACLLAFFLVHMLLLTWADYSYVQPATALAYASVAVLSRFVLHEVISPLRWCGVVTICLGVLIVGRTSPNTTGVE
jgi:drug/metabolite transporter (DMT)-like permease